jgi:hypothetical protein
MNRHSLILLVLTLTPYISDAEVVLSEIMFRAPDLEHYEEFIELYNTSNSAISLEGFLIGDQAEQDSIVDAGEGLLLQPRQFALILDPGYWENSTIYDAVIPETALLVTIQDNAFGAYGLRIEPPDTVILINASGIVTGSLCYTSDNPAGYSEEKIRQENGNDISNWTNSLTYLGTPGFTNSVNPPAADLALTALTVEPNPLPHGTSCTVSVQVTNQGQDPFDNIELVFALGAFQEASPDSLLGSETVAIISPLDSIQTALQVEHPPPGPHHLFAWHTAVDSDPSNDTLMTELAVGYPERSVILNEIYPAPDADQCEWVELYNPNSCEVNLYAFQFSDTDTTDKSVVTTASVSLDAQAYALLAADSAIYSFSPPLDAPVLILESGWPVLNNDGDTPMIFDAAGRLHDAVPYDGWDVPAAQSLERIYVDGASDDPQNWQPSHDPAGCTPGRQNSYGSQIQPPASSGSIAFQPDPFDPDRHEVMQIEVAMPVNAAALSIIVFDLRGRKLKTIFDGGFPPSPLTWNGRDAEDRRLTPGAYILFAEFRDGSGGRQKVIKETFVIAGKL